MSTHNYSIAADTANAKLASDKLADEVEASSIVPTLDAINTDGDSMDVIFTSALSAAEVTTLDGLVAAHDGEPYPVTATPQLVELSDKSPIQKATKVIVYKPEETSFSRVTHDFTNKCTWYTNSLRVTGETLTLDSGTTYSFANQFIIDVASGITNRQDTLQAYNTVVYDNGTPVTSGLTFDCRAGTVTFDSAPTGPVTADYSYSPVAAGSSQWKVSPAAGKQLIIEHSEVQFTDDVEMQAPMKFEVWIDNPYFAVVGHPYEGIPRIPAETVQYNSIRDIINESNLGYQVPSMLGIGRPVVVFPFNYVTVKPLYNALNTELVISSVGDVEMSGTYGTASFYLVSSDDTFGT